MTALGAAAASTTWGIKAEWRERPVGGTYIKVTDGLLPEPQQRNLIPLRVQSSAEWQPTLAPGDYDQQFIRQHLARRRSRAGEAKGRVLYLRGNQSPLAAVTWSLPGDGGPLTVLAAAAAATAFQDDPRDSIVAVELILDCLRAVALEIDDCDHTALAWVIPRSNRERQNRLCEIVHERFRFDGVPRGSVPAHANRYRAAHYMLRPT